MNRKAFYRGFILCFLAAFLGGSLSACGNSPVVPDETPSATLPPVIQETDLLPTRVLPSDTPDPDRVTETALATDEAVQSPTPPEPLYSAQGVVQDNSYCRNGPGTEFGVRFSLHFGDEVRVVGINEQHTWWLVFPLGQAEACWLWGPLLKVEGNTEQIQVALSPSTPTPIPVTAGGESFTAEEYEKKLLELINQARLNQGYPPLSLYPPLVQAAYLHSQDMADHDFFGHLGSDGSDFNQRLTDQGMVFSNGGEMLYAGGDPYQAYQAWINSPVHHDILLNPEFTHIGIGVVYAENRFYEEYVTADLAIPVLPAE